MKAPQRSRRLDASHRPPPAFQEYGADLLNLESITLMSLAERGLLVSMRWKVWANDSLPRDPAALARVLGLEVQDVRANLSEHVLSFFADLEGDNTRLVCPELATQKKKLIERRQKFVDAGHRGGMSSKIKGKDDAATFAATPQVRLAASGKPSEKSRDEKNRNEYSGNGITLTTTRR